MENLMENLMRFVVDILSEPAFLIGAFTVVGLLLLKSSFEKVISGGIKAFVGFLILGAGAGIIIGSLDSFALIFEKAFNIEGVIPHNEAIVSLALVEYGSITATIMIFAMLFNLLFARFTKMKYIFLTGHHTLFMSCLVGVVMLTYDIDKVWVVIFSSMIVGFLMVLMPALAQPYMRKITGNDDVAMGHFGTISYISAGFVGGLFSKDKENSTENLKISKRLSFLRDTTVSLAITMIVLFVVVSLMATPTYIESELSGGKHWLVWCLQEGALFSAGIYVVLAGVRMFLGEIIPAFRGISEKLIPGAKPAVDCPAVFPFAPNAMMIGFVVSFITGFIMMFILPLVGLAVIVPGLVAHFFVGGAAGVFGNATGGVKGCIAGAIINGILISVLPALLLPVLGDLGFASTTFGDPDFAVVGILLSLILGIFN